jgi:hypothetical protein
MMSQDKWAFFDISGSVGIRLEKEKNYLNYHRFCHIANSEEIFIFADDQKIVEGTLPFLKRGIQNGQEFDSPIE